MEGEFTSKGQAAFFDTVDGTLPSNPIPVTKNNIARFNTMLTTTPGLLSLNYKLMEDIEASDLRTDLGTNNNWIAIGTGGAGNRFTGTFDGNNKTRTGLKINTGNGHQGLFGYIDGATVQNVNLAAVNIVVTDNYVGGVIGANNSANGDAIVQNCYATGNVSCTSGNNVGCVVGRNYIDIGSDSAIVQNCYSTSSITGTGTKIGGVVGYAYWSPSGAVSVTSPPAVIIGLTNP